MAFNYAYILSSILTIGLAAFYAGSMYRSLKIGLLTSGVLSILYTLIFMMLQLQDYALMVGSIGLLLLLTLTMYLTRNFVDFST